MNSNDSIKKSCCRLCLMVNETTTIFDANGIRDFASFDDLGI